MLSIVASPKLLRADDCLRDEANVDVAFVGIFSLSAHSLRLLTSLPSTLMARGSAGFSTTVPIYLASSSPAVLCFFFNTAQGQLGIHSLEAQTSQVIILRPITTFQSNPS